MEKNLKHDKKPGNNSGISGKDLKAPRINQ
jgi:hypothetical protein